MIAHVEGRALEHYDDLLAVSALTPGWVRAVITLPGGAGTGIARVGPLTRYVAEVIIEDALRAGRGARLEVELAEDVTDAEVALLGRHFAHLGARGVEMRLHRFERAVFSGGKQGGMVGSSM